MSVSINHTPDASFLGVSFFRNVKKDKLNGNRKTNLTVTVVNN